MVDDASAVAIHASEGEAKVPDPALPDHLVDGSVLSLGLVLGAHDGPYKSFEDAYLRLLGPLTWLKHTRGTADGGRYALETVAIVRGKWCGEDLSIPKLLEDAIDLRESDI